MSDKHIDAYNAKSDKPGIFGQAEQLLRKFKQLSFILFVLFVAILFITIVSLCITPSILLYLTIAPHLTHLPTIILAFSYALLTTLCYFTYGLSSLIIIPIFYHLNPLKPKPFRGPWFSLETMSWYFYNALLYIPRYTFLPFITPTPLLNFFYKMMGMKIGKNTIINTFNISDACMITLGDKVVIGGSATLFAHYGQKGYLVIAPVIIEDEVNIGLKASIMGDVHIGKGAFISAHTVVYPKSRIAPGAKV